MMIELEKSIIVLAGLPLTGKTTVGRALSLALDVPFFDVDETRKEIALSGGWHGPEKEKEIMLASYKRNHEKAREALQEGESVILAATYSREGYHDMLRRLAKENEAVLKIMLLKLPEEIVSSRLRERKREGSSSNITSAESYNEVSERYQAFKGEELSEIDASQPVSAMVDTIIGLLRR